MKPKDTRHLAIKSRRVVLSPQKEPVPALIEIRDGKIQKVSTEKIIVGSHPVHDFGDAVVMPGIVDTHAHINEPGRTEWEGFETATKAAAAGGVTTVIDMPLNSIPPTTSVLSFKRKVEAASGKCSIDYGFWGGLVPGNLDELIPMARAGIWGFKAFLIDSGVEEFPMAGEADLREGMKVLARLHIPLLVHAELDRGAPHAEGDAKSYHRYLKSRPPEWEVEAIRLVIRLMRETGCRVHIVHLSAADAVPDIANARAEGLPLTVETCPHYLTLTAEEVPDGATQFKCAPPIRGAFNRDRLWKALLEGNIDQIVSDHSPCLPKLKDTSGDFGKAWGGIAGLQFSLPVIWTEMRKRKIPLERIAQWMSASPARMAGLDGRKGGLAPGLDADLVVWDPERKFTLTPFQIHHRHPTTPYAGKELYGTIQKTFVRGRPVFEDGHFQKHPFGRELYRKAKPPAGEGEQPT